MSDDAFIILNEWMHLCQMSNDKMLALYREGYLTEDAIEFLHQVRIYRYTHLSEKQAAWMDEIEMHVMQFDAIHAGELNDDDVAGMIKALGSDEPAKPTFRPYQPLGGWDSFKDRG